jgi:hypothetical protein
MLIQAQLIDDIRYRGEFTFGILASGAYVLHSAGADQLLEINRRASKARILLKHWEGSAGSCGETTTLECSD